ncbi:heavy-metal-associated domain-containing protein [Kribbella catacumbae]|uniref:heavy-metal-associated domain-containing protein n=1 Tax=Kribbella catacumbae TaxID=460086 RepID=UPI0003721E9A|nr:heavy metal-associated domain-containing protein [Kribbella catacumbae]
MATELIFEVTGMHCSSCGLLVDDAVEDVPGVTSSTTDVRTGRTTVEIASPGVDPSAIHNAITSTGYSARRLTH